MISPVAIPTGGWVDEAICCLRSPIRRTGAKRRHKCLEFAPLRVVGKTDELRHRRPNVELTGGRNAEHFDRPR